MSEPVGRALAGSGVAVLDVAGLSAPSWSKPAREPACTGSNSAASGSSSPTWLRLRHAGASLARAVDRRLGLALTALIALVATSTTVLRLGYLSARTRVVAISRAAEEGRLEHPPRRGTRFRAGDRAYLLGPYEELLQVLRRDALSPSQVAAPFAIDR